MKLFTAICMALVLLAIPVRAAELTPPPAPQEAQALMPESKDFGTGLMELLDTALRKLSPHLSEAARISASVIAISLSVSLVQTAGDSLQNLSELAGSLCICAAILLSANSMIRLAADTVTSICEYGRLLLPVMTASLAAQGGFTSSTALYAGTAAFTALLETLLLRFMLPMAHLFMAICAAAAMTGEGMLKNLRDVIKTFFSWSLKTLLTVFTTYMAITGAVSGTTDAAALKATKVTIASVVPVVGGILSDASEAVLVSAGLAKNAAGIYGLFAVLAVFLTPFLKIGVHYLMLKLTSCLCGIWAPKRLTELTGDLSTVMGMLLGMTGACCLLQLISTVCFLKGVGP